MGPVAQLTSKQLKSCQGFQKQKSMKKKSFYYQ